MHAHGIATQRHKLNSQECKYWSTPDTPHHYMHLSTRHGGTEKALGPRWDPAAWDPAAWDSAAWDPVAWDPPGCQRPRPRQQGHRHPHPRLCQRNHGQRRCGCRAPQPISQRAPSCAVKRTRSSATAGQAGKIGHKAISKLSACNFSSPFPLT